MEVVCREQSSHHWGRNIFSNMETRAISMQSCWSHFKRNLAFNNTTIYAMVEVNTQVITWANRQQDSAGHIADGNHARLLGSRRMRVVFLPPTRPRFRRIMGDPSQINQIPPVENTVFSFCYLWRTLKTVVGDRSLSNFQTPMCLIRRPFQSYIFVPWTHSCCWTTHPITCYWFN